MSRQWTDLFLELIRLTATGLPADVRREMQAQSCGQLVISAMLDNDRIARREERPLCQDTGVPTFFMKVPESWTFRTILAVQADAQRAVTQATSCGWLRRNVIDTPCDRDVPANCLPGNPVFHVDTWKRSFAEMSLLLKGAGSENVSAQYTLPDRTLSLQGAGRNRQGIIHCALHTLMTAQGRGCAPGILGIAIGGDRETGWSEAKQQLLRPLGKRHRLFALASLEREILREGNRLEIGPMGLGGHPTILDVKCGFLPRHPALYIVTVAYACWALRRARVRVEKSGKALTWQH